MDNRKVLSYLLHLTAIAIYALALFRIWQYVFYSQIGPPNRWELYFAVTTIAVGVGIQYFDDIYKPHDDFIGWAFLLGVGIVGTIGGIFFLFFPRFVQPFRTRALMLLILGIIIIIESLLVRRNIRPSPTNVNLDTLAPILLKFTAIFVIAWGAYQLIWVIGTSSLDLVLVSLQWQVFLLGIGSVIIGALQIVYVETQSRKPSFRMRRIPLLLSFILLLIALPVTSIYLAIPETLILPISLVLDLALIIESFYLVYHPTKAR